MRVLVAKSILDWANAMVLQYHEGKDYRPGTSAIVENLHGELLLVRSAKGPEWDFPKGGSHPDEDIITTLGRELLEETGISTKEIVVNKFTSLAVYDTPGRKREGFERGKAYFHFHVLWNGSGRLVLDPTEIADHRWIPKRTIRGEISALYADNPTKKSRLNKALTPILLD